MSTALASPRPQPIIQVANFIDLGVDLRITLYRAWRIYIPGGGGGGLAIFVQYDSFSRAHALLGFYMRA